MKTHVKTTYECEVCGSEYSHAHLAQECEESVLSDPKYRIGDIVKGDITIETIHLASNLGSTIGHYWDYELSDELDVVYPEDIWETSTLFNEEEIQFLVEGATHVSRNI